MSGAGTGNIWRVFEHYLLDFKLNVTIYNLPHFRVSSKHVAGSNFRRGHVFDFNVVPLSKQIWPKTWLLNFWAATGVPSLLNESFGTEPGNWTHWEKCAGSLKWNELPPQQQRASSKHIALARWHRAGSIFLTETKTRKNWASYVTLSWRTNVKAKKRIHNMYWPGWWRHTELAQGHVAGSICFVFMFFVFLSLKKLSQLRGAEPATRHWASYVALSQQRGNSESVLYRTDGFSDAAFAVPTNQIID